jgi:signal transduction histidine kinase
MVAAATAALANAEPRRVLLLYSYEREFSHYTFARLFRPELTKSSTDPIDFIEMSLQTVRGQRTRTDAEMAEALQTTRGGRPFDLVVTIGGPSATFVQRRKAQLFPATPVLVSAVDSRFLAQGPLPEGMTAITVVNNLQLAMENLLQVLPDVERVVVVIGASGVERFWLEQARRSFSAFEERVTLIWTNELSLADLIKKCSSLPPQSAIFYGIWSLDAHGVPQIEDQTLDTLHATANAPMFGLHSHQLGLGIVGGPLLALDEVSHEAATAALRLLRGEPASSVPSQTLVAGKPIFDGRELRKWGIDESRLPPGSEVRFREPGLWQQNRGLMIVAISAVAAQVLLVVVLVGTHARRRWNGPAESLDLRGAEAALSRLSHRLIQASEQERATIARAINDDVCQQLAALTLQLHALGVETEGRAGKLRWRIEELCAQFWTLEREILAISDPLYHRLAVLGLAASAEAFCQRRCAEAGVDLDFNAQGVPEYLPEPLSVSLFRVLEESLGNALKYSQTPEVIVSLTAADGTIVLEVTDAGVGFDADAELRRGAIGLVGIYERMRLVGGTCTIESRRGKGTRVRVSAPLAGADR